MFVGQFPHTIVHIPGDENCWGGMLSRCATCPGGPVCAHASVKYAEMLLAGGDGFPTKEVVRGFEAATVWDILCARTQASSTPRCFSLGATNF